MYAGVFLWYNKAKEVITMKLGEAIENILVESGLTISAFSRKVGYSRQYIYELLKSKDTGFTRKIQLDTLKRICDATDYSLEKLLADIDYIPKPYPQAEIILARILRAIELSEDRDIIQSTERDPLTGLYNREYFYRYAEQYDYHHPGKPMDAIVLDVCHFHIINRFAIHYIKSLYFMQLMSIMSHFVP